MAGELEGTEEGCEALEESKPEAVELGNGAEVVGRHDEGARMRASRATRKGGRRTVERRRRGFSRAEEEAAIGVGFSGRAERIGSGVGG